MINKTIAGQVDYISPFGIGYPLGPGGYSTGANTNILAVLAICFFMGVFVLKRYRTA